MNYNKLTFTFLFFLLLATLGLTQESSLGTVGVEVKDQIGVYEVMLSGVPTLEKGDIVTIHRGGEMMGEATVLDVDGSTARVSQKGVFDTQSGDTVQFARKARGVQATSNGSGSRSQGGNGIHKRCGGQLDRSNYCSNCKVWISKSRDDFSKIK